MAVSQIHAWRPKQRHVRLSVSHVARSQPAVTTLIDFEFCSCRSTGVAKLPQFSRKINARRREYRFPVRINLLARTPRRVPRDSVANHPRLQRPSRKTKVDWVSLFSFGSLEPSAVIELKYWSSALFVSCKKQVR